MNRTTIHELQSHLSRYLDNTSTLEEFRHWFDEATWGIAAEPDSLVRQLAGELELRIAEFTNGHLAEDGLQKLLRALAPDSDFQIPVTYDEPVEVTFS